VRRFRPGFVHEGVPRFRSRRNTPAALATLIGSPENFNAIFDPGYPIRFWRNGRELSNQICRATKH
jgi:hypothetical protein